MRVKTAVALLAGGFGATVSWAATPECSTNPQVQLDKIEARAIVVGEVHGMEQTPQFVAQLACALLRNGKPVILALERDGSEQVALNTYLASAGKPDDVRALIGTGAWAQTMQDGRNSRAMLALIEQMRQWKQAGQRVGILAMQQEYHEIVPPETQRPPLSDADLARYALLNDRAMADKMWVTLIANPSYTVVALAGNMHTAIGSKARARSVASPSFAEVLASYIPIHVIGLNGAGGTSWNITAYGTPGGVRSSIAGPLYMHDSRVDSQVDVGKTTASPPANTP